MPWFVGLLLAVLASSLGQSEATETANKTDLCGTKPEKRIVCHYQADLNEFQLEDLDPCLCTHLVYGSIGLDADMTFTDRNQDNMKSLKTLRLKNPSLKTLLSVKDASVLGSTPLRFFASNTTTTDQLGKKLRRLVQETGTNGIDIEWTYESSNNTNATDEKLTLTNFLKRLRSALDDVTLTLTTSQNPSVLIGGYDFRNISKYVDFINIPAFQFDCNKSVVHHHGRLHGVADMQNMDSLVDLLLTVGTNKEKIVVAIPTFGVSYKLANENETKPGSPTDESGKPMVMTHPEICVAKQTGNWTLVREKDQTAPYVFKGKTWIGFDDELTFRLKSKYILLRNLGGVMVWTVNQDDYRGMCGNGNFPLLRSIHDVLSGSKYKGGGANGTDELEEYLDYSESRVVEVTDQLGNLFRTDYVGSDTIDGMTCTRQGYYRNPVDCTRFYRCVKFNQQSDAFSIFQYDCPPGLVFDETHELCNWPSWSPPCAGSGEVLPRSRNDFHCPDLGYYRDPENCRVFFYCSDVYDNGTLSSYEFKCPYNLAFDEEKLSCDWPLLVSGCAEKAGFVGVHNGYASGVIQHGGILGGASSGLFNAIPESQVRRGFRIKPLNGYQGYATYDSQPLAYNDGIGLTDHANLEVSGGASLYGEARVAQPATLVAHQVPGHNIVHQGSRATLHLNKEILNQPTGGVGIYGGVGVDTRPGLVVESEGAASILSGGQAYAGNSGYRQVGYSITDGAVTQEFNGRVGEIPAGLRSDSLVLGGRTNYGPARGPRGDEGLAISSISGQELPSGTPRSYQHFIQLVPQTKGIPSPPQPGTLTNRLQNAVAGLQGNVRAPIVPLTTPSLGGVRVLGGSALYGEGRIRTAPRPVQYDIHDQQPDFVLRQQQVPVLPTVNVEQEVKSIHLQRPNVVQPIHLEQEVKSIHKVQPVKSTAYQTTYVQEQPQVVHVQQPKVVQQVQVVRPILQTYVHEQPQVVQIQQQKIVTPVQEVKSIHQTYVQQPQVVIEQQKIVEPVRFEQQARPEVKSTAYQTTYVQQQPQVVLEQQKIVEPQIVLEQPKIVQPVQLQQEVKSIHQEVRPVGVKSTAYQSTYIEQQPQVHLEHQKIVQPVHLEQEVKSIHKDVRPVGVKSTAYHTTYVQQQPQVVLEQQKVFQPIRLEQEVKSIHKHPQVFEQIHVAQPQIPVVQQVHIPQPKIVQQIRVPQPQIPVVQQVHVPQPKIVQHIRVPQPNVVQQIHVPQPQIPVVQQIHVQQHARVVQPVKSTAYQTAYVQQQPQIIAQPRPRIPLVHVNVPRVEPVQGVKSINLVNEYIPPMALDLGQRQEYYMKQQVHPAYGRINYGEPAFPRVVQPVSLLPQPQKGDGGNSPKPRVTINFRELPIAVKSIHSLPQPSPFPPNIAPNTYYSSVHGTISLPGPRVVDTGRANYGQAREKPIPIQEISGGQQLEPLYGVKIPTEPITPVTEVKSIHQKAVIQQPIVQEVKSIHQVPVNPPVSQVYVQREQVHVVQQPKSIHQVPVQPIVIPIKTQHRPPPPPRPIRIEQPVQIALPPPPRPQFVQVQQPKVYTEQKSILQPIQVVQRLPPPPPKPIVVPVQPVVHLKQQEPVVHVKSIHRQPPPQPIALEIPVRKQVPPPPPPKSIVQVHFQAPQQVRPKLILHTPIPPLVQPVIVPRPPPPQQVYVQKQPVPIQKVVQPVQVHVPIHIPQPVVQVKSIHQEIKVQQPVQPIRIDYQRLPPPPVQQVKVLPPPPVQQVKVEYERLPPPPIQEVKVLPPPPVQQIKVLPPPPIQQVKVEYERLPPPPIQEVRVLPPPPVQQIKVDYQRLPPPPIQQFKAVQQPVQLELPPPVQVYQPIRIQLPPPPVKTIQIQRPPLPVKTVQIQQPVVPVKTIEARPLPPRPIEIAIPVPQQVQIPIQKSVQIVQEKVPVQVQEFRPPPPPVEIYQVKEPIQIKYPAPPPQQIRVELQRIPKIKEQVVVQPIVEIRKTPVKSVQPVKSVVRPPPPVAVKTVQVVEPVRIPVQKTKSVQIVDPPVVIQPPPKQGGRANYGPARERRPRPPQRLEEPVVRPVSLSNIERVQARPTPPAPLANGPQEPRQRGRERPQSTSYIFRQPPSGPKSAYTQTPPEEPPKPVNEFDKIPAPAPNTEGARPIGGSALYGEGRIRVQPENGEGDGSQGRPKIRVKYGQRLTNAESTVVDGKKVVKLQVPRGSLNQDVVSVKTVKTSAPVQIEAVGNRDVVIKTIRTEPVQVPVARVKTGGRLTEGGNLKTVQRSRKRQRQRQRVDAELIKSQTLPAEHRGQDVPLQSALNDRARLEQGDVGVKSVQSGKASDQNLPVYRETVREAVVDGYKSIQRENDGKTNQGDSRRGYQSQPSSTKTSSSDRSPSNRESSRLRDGNDDQSRRDDEGQSRRDDQGQSQGQRDGQSQGQRDGQGQRESKKGRPNRRRQEERGQKLRHPIDQRKLFETSARDEPISSRDRQSVKIKSSEASNQDAIAVTNQEPAQTKRSRSKKKGKNDLPDSACTRPGLFRHPDNCNKFYECFYDKWLNKFTLHMFDCPIRLAFDDKVFGCTELAAKTPCKTKKTSKED